MALRGTPTLVSDSPLTAGAPPTQERQPKAEEAPVVNGGPEFGLPNSRIPQPGEVPAIHGGAGSSPEGSWFHERQNRPRAAFDATRLPSGPRLALTEALADFATRAKVMNNRDSQWIAELCDLLNLRTETIHCPICSMVSRPPSPTCSECRGQGYRVDVLLGGRP